MKRRLFLFSLLATSISSSFAAIEKDVGHLNLHVLSQVPLKEIQREVDVNQMTHIRLQQMYEGLRVWGGEVIVHLPKGETTLLSTSNRAKLNGLIYENVEKDLKKPALKIPNVNRAEMAMETAMRSYSASMISQKKNELMIYVDESQQAHYAYLIRFFVKSDRGLPEAPIFIIDAETFKIYQQWNNIQTAQVEADGGGFGGNPKMGQLIYDGLNDHLAKLRVNRVGNHCFLQNSDVTVKDYRQNDSAIQYECQFPDSTHNNVFWSGDFDTVNGAYSPANDALSIGQIIKAMYQEWYGIPVLTDANGPMMLNMRVHLDDDNAYWYESEMVFGDGGKTFYPFVSLGVGAHEISHGFTEQHSHLLYKYQSGGLNESFSDMAAQAAEFYRQGVNSWIIGAEIFKGDGALRYMDRPSKDCGWKRAGNDCSIDHVKQYYDGLDMHYSSGVYNRAFYLMANTPGWNTRKAFDVMVAANRYYWTMNATFASAACGVLSATADLGYSVNDVKLALRKVGIDTMHC